MDSSTFPKIISVISNHNNQNKISTSENLPTSFKTTSFLYYHAFSRLTYYLLITPYKTELEFTQTDEGNSRSKLVIKTNFVQKVSN